MYSGRNPQCVLKWGRNLYDIDMAFENGLQFKERVEKLPREFWREVCDGEGIPVNRQNIICNALWKGFLTDSYMFEPSKAPDYCTFVLLASVVDAVANVSGGALLCWFMG